MPTTHLGREVVWAARLSGRGKMRTPCLGQGRLGVWNQKPMASAPSQRPPLGKPCDQVLLGAEGEVCCSSGTTPYHESCICRQQIPGSGQNRTRQFWCCPLEAEQCMTVKTSAPTRVAWQGQAPARPCPNSLSPPPTPWHPPTMWKMPPSSLQTFKAVH